MNNPQSPLFYREGAVIIGAKIYSMTIVSAPTASCTFINIQVGQDSNKLLELSLSAGQVFLW
jgi:hypothetical protein